MKRILGLFLFLVASVSYGATTDIRLSENQTIQSWTTSITLNSSDAASCPDPAQVGSYAATVFNSSIYVNPTVRDTTYEIWTVTAKSGSTITVTRGNNPKEYTTSAAKVVKFRCKSDTNTFTPTNTPTGTHTPTPTNTPTNTFTHTPTNTFTNTFTFTPTFTHTHTFTPTNTPTPGNISVNTDAAAGKVGTTAGWVVRTNNNIGLQTLPASQTGSTLVVPIMDLPVGWRIEGFNLIGQVESAGGEVIITADMRKQTAAAADVSDASIGSVGPVTITADTILSGSNVFKYVTPDSIALDETFYVLVTATTAASTDIALQGVRTFFTVPTPTPTP